MDDITTAFEKLLGRAATDQEKQELWRVKDALELGNNDALWLILIALHHYETIYRSIPGAIAKQAAAVLDKQKESLAQVAATAEAEARQSLASAVADAAAKVADHRAKAGVWRWTGMGAVCLAFLAAGSGYAGYRAGLAKGWAQGYENAREEKAASAWANTPQGRRALVLAESGALDLLVSCGGRGWKQDKGFCYPWAYTADDGKSYQTGWTVP